MNKPVTTRLAQAVLLSLAMACSSGALAAQIVADNKVEHVGTFGGKKVRYTSYIENFAVADGEAKADLVVMSHVARNASKDRPVLFAFNGGPISSSLFLHVGSLAPKRIAFPDDLAADPATFPVVDNKYTVLDVADIVLFDPAGTGLSRVSDGTDITQFASVDADARQLAAMIAEWSKRHGREDSPKFLLGESYGTLRAAAAAHEMQLGPNKQRVDGVFLLGQALNIIEYAQRQNNIISYVVSLPTVAATAWHFNKVDKQGKTHDAWLDEVREWARTDYLTALFQGQFLPQAEKRRVAEKLAGYTGIDVETLLREELKLTKDEQRVELLRDEGKVLGVYDTRYAGAPDPAHPHPSMTDPSGATMPAFFRGMDVLLRDQFGVKQKVDYRRSAEGVGGFSGWDWGRNKSPFGDWPYMEWVRKVMEVNPTFRVVMGHGHHDTATTTGASDYAVAHSGWPLDRVQSVYYIGGHMPYTIESSLEEFTDDLRSFIKGDKQ